MQFVFIRRSFWGSHVETDADGNMFKPNLHPLVMFVEIESRAAAEDFLCPFGDPKPLLLGIVPDDVETGVWHAGGQREHPYEVHVDLGHVTDGRKAWSIARSLKTSYEQLNAPTPASSLAPTKMRRRSL